MKKLLALVLALVMTLGLATVGASAAYDPGYKDKSDIDYTEATNIMTVVGVFEGKGENFAPKDNLNRAEAAKLIAYLMLGNKTAEAMKGTGTRFTDVPASHWAVGYIEYLATSGIVSGVGDGKFDPNGQVTTVAFAKMLDVALGYDAQIEGFVGEGWNINIMKKANDNDLFEQLDLNSNDAITREQAAQMCLNALQAKTYEYDSKGTTVSLGDAKVVVDAKTAKPKTNSDNKKVRAIKEKMDSYGKYYLELGEDLYNGDLKLEKGNSKDDFGRPADKWTYKSEDVGTYTNKSDLVETFTKKVTQGMLYDTVGKSVYDSIKDGKSELYYYEDGVLGQHLDLANAASDARTNDLKKYIQKDGDKKINDGNSTGNGTVTEVFLKNKETNTNNVYSNSHDVVTIVVSNTYLLKAASEYRASTEDIVFETKSLLPSGGVFDGTRLKLEDHPEIKDMAKDDYILVTAHKDGGKYKIDTAKKAEVLTGKVDQVVVEDSVTIDGEKLSLSNKIDATSKAETYSIGEQAKVVLDPYGYVIYVDEAVSASNYVFISEFFSSGNSSTAKPKANAYFTDGTTSEITVKEVYDGTGKYTEIGALDDATSPTGYAAGKVVSQKFVGWYSYSKNASGEYTLNRLGSSYKKAAQFLSGTTSANLLYSDRVNFENAGDVSAAFVDTTSFGTLKANDKTIMIVTQYGKNDVDVYTGVKNLPEVNLDATNGKGVIFAVMDGSYAKYVFVSVTDAKVLGSNDQNLLYVIKYDKQNKGSDNETYYTFKAVDVDGNEVTIQADSQSTFQYGDFNHTSSEKIYGAYYSTSRNANGRYTGAEASTVGQVDGKYGNYVGLTSGSNAITGSSGTISFGSVAYTLDKDCKLIVISKVDALNRLQGADHEITVYSSGESVESMLKSYTYTYDVQFKLTDSTNGKLSEAYITIRSATATTSA